MKIEELVLSIEQINHLKKIGLIINDTALSHIGFSIEGEMVFDVEKTGSFDFISDIKEIPTFTIHEIIKTLPNSIYNDGVWYDLRFGKHYVGYVDENGKSLFYEIQTDLIEAAYNMLCWVLENGYLK